MKEKIIQWGKNLIGNVLWVVSAVMWCQAQYWREEYYRRSVCLAAIAAILVAAVGGSIFQKVRKAAKSTWIFAGLTTVGAVIFPINYLEVAPWISIASAWFIFSLLVILYEYLKEIFADVCSDIEKKEWIVFGGIVFVYFVFLVFSFSKSQAFYGTRYSGDLIYTADSKSLVQGHVYLQLLHPENDLRQPLFAVVATPFMGLAYLLSLVFASVPYVSSICLGTAQMLLLLFTLFMLMKILKADKKERVLFFILVCLMYPSILFSVMMEQYVVAVFWVVLYIYALVVKNKKDDLALIGASGSLLTSAALVIVSEETEKFDWKKYITRILEIAGKGVFAMLLFCRTDVISTVFDKIDSLKEFSGESVPMRERLLQYIYFVKSCFVAPEAGESWALYDRPSWQLDKIESISAAGVILILLAVVGFWKNRKQLLTKICGFWILHSVAVLCILGWGTAENGLILYTFYYGWAYWILVYQCIRYWLDKCKPWIKYAVWVFILLLLLIMNGKGILELLIFARTNYPA